MVNAVPHRKRFAPAKRRRHVPQPVDGGGAVDVVAEKTKGRAADLRRWHGTRSESHERSDVSLQTRASSRVRDMC